jgi:glycosyltransferase involved in cell wall biosynthesis
MKILHICNDFSNSKVHVNLYSQIDDSGLEQIVFQPLRRGNEIEPSVIKFSNPNSKIIYSKAMSIYHRLFFRKKINFLYPDLIKGIDENKVDIQHATTLFSDGALAYKLNKLHNIPYLITVRNTDVNLFLNLRPDLYVLAKKILQNASRIIFISVSFKNKFFKNFYFKKLENTLSDKVHIIHNGIDDFWLKNITLPKKETNLSFLLVGKFDVNKNVLNLIKALNVFKNKNDKVTLNLVGGGGSNHKKVMRLVKENSWIVYHGKIFNKKELKKLYLQNDFFLMPSKFETFGLVYIEALSQGLPILYTENQGVDGLFDSGVGVATNPWSTKHILLSIEDLVFNSSFFKKNIAVLDFDIFSWENIYKNHYKKIYESLN